MRSATHLLKLLAIGVFLAEGLFSASAIAGPATYDKESKSFRMTYTFANLDGAGIGDGVIGAAYKPTPDEEQLINALAAQVSDLLFKATEGRAKIGRLDFVDDIKNADFVVSKTGKPSSSGWATRGAIDNKPGYIVLYYETLLRNIKQDVVYTGAHEVSHYVFGLIDEYTLPGGCPARSGPGCLMDNYFSSMRGYMGRFCNSADPHNVSQAQQLSCQQIVDQFFAERGVEKDPSSVDVAAADPRTILIVTAIGKVREKRLEDLAKKKPGSSAGTSNLQTFAKKFFTGLIDDFNRNNNNQAIFTPDQIDKALDLIVRAGSVVPAAKPKGLTDTLFNQIKAEAAKLGKDVESVKSESSRASKIRSQLSSFIRGLIKENVVKADDFPKDQQKELIDRLVQQEARSPQDKALDRLLGISDVGVRLNREIASNIVDVLDELGAPGIAARRNVLRGFDEELKRLSIPGRTSATFGGRRTRFINPDPLDPKYCYMLSQGGVVPYVLVRDCGFRDFSRLIDRERIELVQPNFPYEKTWGPAISVRIDRPFEAAEFASQDRIRQARNNDFPAWLEDLFDQVQRDRLENVVVLVPPGGLPPSLEQSLTVFKAKLAKALDVRLDIAIVGFQKIPTTLRDLCVRSGGLVLSITDIDEIGAIAQRLKNEQTSGSWIILPQQSTIPQSPGTVPNPLVPVSNLTNEANKKNDTLKSALDSAGERLDKIAQASDSRPSPLVRATAQEATTLVNQIRNNLKNLRDLLQPDNQRKSAQPDSQKNSPMRDPLLSLIVDFKLQIPKAKNMIRSACQLVADDWTANGLSGIVKDLQSEKKLGEDLVKLDKLARLYDRVFEEMAMNSFPAVYQRIDRVGMEQARRAVEAQKASLARPIFNATAEETRVRLARFYVEKDAVNAEADLELIVGLSRPLPGINLATNSPLIQLRDDSGSFVDTSGAAAKDDPGNNLQIDLDASSETLLVYRVRFPRRLPEKAYTPFLLLDQATIKEIKNDNEDTIKFTFSVGSTRRNVQLLTGLVGDLTKNTRGTLRSTDRNAVVEVLVSAGSAVLGAKVVGFCQRITPGVDSIPIEKYDFQDEGQVVRPAFGDLKEIRDKTAGDGIYTASIPIDGVTQGTEFRVFIQADTSDGKAHYIPLDDPNRGEPEKNDPSIRNDQSLVEGVKQAQAQAEGPALKFQRATSVQFWVEP